MDQFTNLAKQGFEAYEKMQNQGGNSGGNQGGLSSFAEEGYGRMHRRLINFLLTNFPFRSAIVATSLSALTGGGNKTGGQNSYGSSEYSISICPACHHAIVGGKGRIGPHAPCPPHFRCAKVSRLRTSSLVAEFNSCPTPPCFDN
ncbi:hypothetical protein DL93DRAFT_2070468 [Clavulina sp. PMI_390]|nr:hypothetical protein DL93DRAFT_2070468 [Clavulina sp. PMI_390]